MASRRQGQRAGGTGGGSRERTDDTPIIDIYGRLSYRSDGSVINVDEQIEAGKKDINRRGGVVGKIFRDDAKSAWNPRVERLDWNRLMERLESGVSDGVWVLEVTRFSRKIMEGERLVQAAQLGRLVWSAGGEYDLSLPDGRKAFRDAMTAAAAESDKIAYRVRRGNRIKAEQGRDPYGGIRGFGMVGYLPKEADWEHGDLRTPVDKDVVRGEQEIVRECYRRLLAGEITVSPLARELNERGIRTVHGNVWERATLAAMLTRPSLCGAIMVDGEKVANRRNFRPVVSEDDWELLCALLAARRPGPPAGRRHMLSGLLGCVCRTARMYGQSQPHVPPYPGGEMKRAYLCKVTEKGGCGNWIDARAAEEIVRTAVIARLSDPRVAATIQERADTRNSVRLGIQTQLDHWESEADELSKKVGTWTVARVDRSMEPIVKKIAELTERLSVLDAPEDTRVLADDIAARWVAAETTGDHDALRSMIRLAFPAMVLHRPAYIGDYRESRFDWDGTRPVVALPSPEDLVRQALATPDGRTVRDLSVAAGRSYHWANARVKKWLVSGEVVTVRAARGGTGRGGSGPIPALYALASAIPPS